jgi:transcriptional regulator with XRE-family HTH domain
MSSSDFEDFDQKKLIKLLRDIQKKEDISDRNLCSHLEISRMSLRGWEKGTIIMTIPLIKRVSKFIHDYGA